MPNRLHLWRASWTLVDQGILSAGSFALNILLARRMVPAEYGIFVLVYSGLIILQLFNAALLVYPLSVRLVMVDRQDQARLTGATLLLVGLLSAGLSVPLTIVLVGLGRPDLALPALACFLAWQTQEATRRGLLTSFRIRAAIPGDLASYLGQVGVVGVLALTGSLTLASVLYAMAATSVAAMAIQAWQLRLRVSRSLRLWKTVADYWRVGGFWSLGNGLLIQLLSQGPPWVLAALGGTAAVAGLQAANSIVNLSNPIVFGLCNIIPQTASQASVGGNEQAWRATRGYATLALLVLAGYSLFVVVLPEFILRTLYGPHSQYLGIAGPLRLLIVGTLPACFSDIVGSYLHGVAKARLAFAVSGMGALVAAALAWPMIDAFGLLGACATATISNAVRFFVARAMLTRTIGKVRRRHDPPGSGGDNRGSDLRGDAMTGTRKGIEPRRMEVGCVIKDSARADAALTGAVWRLMAAVEFPGP